MGTVKAVVHLESTTPYSQSRYIMATKPAKMKHDEWEEQSWRQRGWEITTGPDKGKMYIPAQQFKNALIEAAKYLGMKVKGKGQATYTKHFTSGILIENDMILPVKLADCEADTVMVSADGKPGGAKKDVLLFFGLSGSVSAGHTRCSNLPSSPQQARLRGLRGPLASRDHGFSFSSTVRPSSSALRDRWGNLLRRLERIQIHEQGKKESNRT